MEKERKYSEQEKVRLKEFKEMTEKLEKEGYEKHEITIDVIKANIYAIGFFAIFAVIFGLLFHMNGYDFEFEFFANSLLGLVVFIVSLVVSIIVHELIHGLTFGAFAPNHFKTVQFGFIKENLTPYCTCAEPLKKYQIILAMAMPCIVLGLIPSIIAVFNGSFDLLLYGLIMIGSAGGDLTIIYLILKNPSKKKDVIYRDHPTEVGSVMFDR